VVPVDLNAFLARAEEALARLTAAAGRINDSTRYAAAAAARRASIDAVMWDDAARSWRDVTLAGAARGDDGAWRGTALSRAVTAANWAPLWTPAGVPPSPHAPAAVAGLEASGLVGVGGVATTTVVRSPEQWDGANAWPPLQAVIAEGCVAAACPQGDALAERVVAGLVANAAAGVAADGAAREKYRADAADGTAGGGGEYVTQTGFGWTHGAVLALAARFGWAPSAERARRVGE
jgi:alpha,alpha-trehalase